MASIRASTAPVCASSPLQQLAVDVKTLWLGGCQTGFLEQVTTLPVGQFIAIEVDEKWDDIPNTLSSIGLEI